MSSNRALQPAYASPKCHKAGPASEPDFVALLHADTAGLFWQNILGALTRNRAIATAPVTFPAERISLAPEASR